MPNSEEIENLRSFDTPTRNVSQRNSKVSKIDLKMRIKEELEGTKIITTQYLPTSKITTMK